MKNLLFLILIVTGCKSVDVTKPFTYRIKFLESNQIKYTNQITNSKDYPSNVVIYKYINGKYLQII